MSTTELLTKVPLFKGLETEELQRLASATESVSFRPGETIVEIGDTGKSLYVLVEGSVQVLYPARSSDFELARLGPGDFFGEMALLNDKPRSATVKAVGTVRALKLDKDGFRRIILEAPRVGLKVLEVLSFRIRSADEQISGLSDQSQRDPRTRLLNRR
ncbi:MAG TPA: cyclic nucleotide-binding domain-containing protein, partial [Candidatus Thermoplasmatota archaeon]